MQEYQDVQAGSVQAPTSYHFPTSQEALLSWSHVTSRLEVARYYWLGTTRHDGRPHVTPLWGCWIDNRLYVDGSPQTHWAKNIATNPNVTIHLESGEDVVILEGIVVDLDALDDHALADRIVADWDKKYGRLHPEPQKNGIFRFTPQTARAWSKADLSDGTRWKFQ